MSNAKGINKKGSSQTKTKDNNNSKIYQFKPTKRTLADNVYYLGSAKQASDYESITEFLINYIKKTFTYGMDIGTVLESLQELDLNEYKPSLSVSLNHDEIIRMAEDKQFEIEFKSEYDVFTKRKQALEMNLSKAYSFIWDQCAKSLQNKIEARSDYISIIKGNPINLLKAIKQQVLNYEESRYEMSIILEALKNMINVKQKEGETLQDYTKRFKTIAEVMESHIGGPIELTKCMSKMVEFNLTDGESVVKCKTKAFEQFLAYTYMEGADKSKYGSLLSGLQTQYSLGNNQYPRTVSDANSVLSNHKFDNPNKIKYSAMKNETINDNKVDESPELSFSQMNGKCYCCGKAGHKSPDCRWNSKPKREWAINKIKNQQSNRNTGKNGQPSSTTATNSTSSQFTSATSSVMSGWSGANVQFYQALDMKSIILLDNQSTVSLFCNKDYVERVWEVKEQLELATNGGALKTNQKALVKGFGEVWFHSGAITNIFSSAEMEDKHQITYDSKAEHAFIVHLPDKEVKFVRSPNGLYYFNPPYSKNQQTCNTNVPMDSVQENMKMFTNRQIERAKLTRKIHHALGAPSPSDFKLIVTTNAIKNLPINVEDIKTAEMIFGTDIGILKGKTVRRKPLPVSSDYVEVPKELINNHQDVTLCVDIMNINGLSFLTTVSRKIMYRTTEFIPSQSVQHYRSALDTVFQIYNHAGFKITTIHCDNEFQPIMKEMEKIYGIRMNYANPQEHVPEIERSIRVIKERFRVAFHRLPFKIIPKIMIKILAMECTKKLNFFPPKDGISNFYSPRTIMHQQTLDYSKQCAIPFGTYVQAHNEPTFKNSQHPRAIDCIYLRYVDNFQGGNHLLDLNTGQTIKTRTITQVPITQNVIELVHKLAEADGIQEGLKITNKKNVILFDSSWIAGVDYEDKSYVAEEDDSIQGDERDEMNPNEILEARQNRVTVDNDINADNIDHENEESSNPEEPADASKESEEESDEYESESDELQEVPEGIQRTRSGRITKPPSKLNLNQCHLNTQGHERTEYSIETGEVIAKNIIGYNHKCHYQFAETYGLKKGIKKFGERGYKAAMSEMQQLHERVVFKPVNVGELTQQEKRRAMDTQSKSKSRNIIRQIPGNKKGISSVGIGMPS